MSRNNGIVIAIDGPSGVGKSSISRELASRLGFTYLDTGAMYRAVALFFLRASIDLEDNNRVNAALERINIELSPARNRDEDVMVRLNGEEVGHLIRTPEISMLASRVSAHPSVREKLTSIQKRLGKDGTIVAEGRDTGTVVFPDAKYKFFLDATPEERTSRRVRQLRARGEQVNEKKLLKQTIKRDKDDSERLIAPLKKADDAVYIDTTFISETQVLEKISAVISEKG